MSARPSGVEDPWRQRSTGLFIGAAALGLAAILAVVRHDVEVAVATFFAATMFAQRGGRHWHRENAMRERLDSAGTGA